MKHVLYRVIAALNILAIIALLASGYSGYINPTSHSLWALMGYAFPFILFVNVAFIVVWVFVKKRYVVLPVVGLALAYWPIRTYVPLNASTQAPDHALKVLSYNILCFNRDQAPKGKPNPILQYIVDSKADIVCLQEYSLMCDRDSLWSKCRKIYPYRDTLMCSSSNAGNFIALFSKYPILSKEHILIKSEGNCAGSFMVDIKGRRVCVINLHLETVGLSKEEKKNFSDIVHGNTQREEMKHDSRNLVGKVALSSITRSAQADVVHDYIRQKLADARANIDSDKDGGIILCGDFNDHPLSYVHHTIADELTDCYTASGRGPGFTMHINSMYFRIDNIMCSDKWQPYQCTVDKSIALSDHYPIYCYFKLKKEQ